MEGSRNRDSFCVDAPRFHRAHKVILKFSVIVLFPVYKSFHISFYHLILQMKNHLRVKNKIFQFHYEQDEASCQGAAASTDIQVVRQVGVTIVVDVVMPTYHLSWVYSYS